MQVDTTEPCSSTQAHWLCANPKYIQIINGTLWKEVQHKPSWLGSVVITEGPSG